MAGVIGSVLFWMGVAAVGMACWLAWVPLAWLWFGCVGFVVGGVMYLESK